MNAVFIYSAAMLGLAIGSSVVVAQELRPSQAGSEREVTETAQPQTGPSGIITTVAGDGYVGIGGDGGPATQADLLYPNAAVVDKEGNLYISEYEAQVVRKVVASTGIISVYAGTGLGGYSGDHGPATSAKLNEPGDLALDATGNLYISDAYNQVVRMVNARTGIITTVAGNGSGASNGDSPSECGLLAENVLATKTDLCLPAGLAVDASGDLYIADSIHEVIRKVNVQTGIITTVAGNGRFGYSGDGRSAVDAELDFPLALALDGSGNLFIADFGNCRIRKVNAKTGIITTFAGGGTGNGPVCILSDDGQPAAKAGINFPGGVAVDSSGNVYISDPTDDVVRMVDAKSGVIDTIAGSYFTTAPGSVLGSWGYLGDGGPAAYASLDNPTSVTTDTLGSVYIADENNGAIRKVVRSGVLPIGEPEISFDAQANLPSVPVTITSPVHGSTIYYTTDGSVPSTSSTKYTAPFRVTNSTAILAFAAPPSAPNSTAALADYFYSPAPRITPGSGVFTRPIKVTIADANPRAQIYYTTDGSSPEESAGARLYTGPVTIAAGTTLTTEAWVHVNNYGVAAGKWSVGKTALYWKSAQPEVTTLAASNVSVNSVSLSGLVVPNSSSVTCYFIYGTSKTALNLKGDVQSLPAGTEAVQIYDQIYPSKPKTTYYFRLVAKNSAATSYGDILSFTTPAQ